MKKANVWKSVLCFLILIGLLPFSVLAAEGSIDISSVDFSAYEDGYGVDDQEYVTVSIRFTVPASVTELSVLLLGEDVAAVTEGNKDKVIYMSQVAVPADGILEFPVAVSRICSATGLTDPNGAALFLRVGARDMETCSRELSFTMVQPAYGDVNGDGYVDVGDAVMVLRYIVGLVTLTTKQYRAADVVQNGEVDLNDAVRILRYEAGFETTILKEA